MIESRRWKRKSDTEGSYLTEYHACIEKIKQTEWGVRNTYCTIHGQSRGETRSTGGIAGHAGIFPGVTRRHGVYRQQTDTPAGRDRYIGIIVGDRFTIESPFDLNRRITLQHGAGCGDRVSPVCWFLTDHERSYLGSN